MNGLMERLAGAIRGTGSTAFIVVGAILIGFGVPLLWIWLASMLYGKPGAVTTAVALFILVGIAVSYWGLLLVFSWIRARLIDPEGQTAKRASWNRSLRDTPFRPGEGGSDPIEVLFVVTAIISLVAFVIWFAFFAGAPFPAN